MKPALVREVARLADIFRLRESPTEHVRFAPIPQMSGASGGAAKGIKFDPIPAY